MGIRIKTNTVAIAAQRTLGESQKNLNNSLERLSSGQRINRSSDDAAGLAVSERLHSKIASLNVAKRNANDGVSYIQVAEGGLNEITNIIVRMRELASQAASDTVGSNERGFLNKEFQQLKEEVGRIQETTEFNGAMLLKDPKEMQIFIGATNRSTMGGAAPANGDNDVLKIKNSDLESLTASLDDVLKGKNATMEITGTSAPDLGDSSGNTDKIFAVMDTALDSIAGYRATLGSVQARLNSAITNIEISNENLSAARSRIRDVDYAEESTKFAQAKILSTAGTSVLTQANQMPEIALGLIRG